MKVPVSFLGTKIIFSVSVKMAVLLGIQALNNIKLHKCKEKSNQCLIYCNEFLESHRGWYVMLWIISHYRWDFQKCLGLAQPHWCQEDGWMNALENLVEISMIRANQGLFFIYALVCGLLYWNFGNWENKHLVGKIFIQKIIPHILVWVFLPKESKKSWKKKNGGKKPASFTKSVSNW